MTKKLLLVFLFISALITDSNAQISFTENAIALGVTSNYGIEQSTSGAFLLGGGISFCDFDGDGWDDLTFSTASGLPIKLFKNNSGTFTETSLTGITLDTNETRQIIWVDYDNDADKDLFIATFDGSNKLYQNNGSFSFTDVTNSAGFPSAAYSTVGSSWGDYNNDGFLDVFLSSWDNDASSTDANKLYKNNGDGTFTDVSSIAGIDNDSHLSFCAAFFDYDNDGWQDIYIANDRPYNKNIMYHNNGDGTFTDTSVSTGTDVELDAMSTTISDYDNDGDLDIYITNTNAGNAFLQNNGNGTFTDIASTNGTLMETIAWGAVFLDADNDMDSDLYVSGMLTTTSPLPSAFYENNGSGSFAIPSSAGFQNDDAVSFSNAIGDIDNDGYPDISVLNFAPRNNFLFKNNNSTNNYLKVKLQGTTSNRDGVGSWIQVYNNGVPQNRYTLAGEGYTSQNSNYEFFGLGSETVVDMLKVTWLSGTVDVLYNVAVNQSMTIEEGSSLEIDEFDFSNLIRVYPNPSSNGFFQLNSSQLDRSKDYEITVFDPLGKMVIKKKINFVNDFLDLEDYTKGIYFLQMESNNQSIVKKLIYL
ncbi:MAG: hypothetical protein COA67_03750 [Lutibacter sp.]|nr:MAG: hypothetical protein COA67_03750 [Lutibacter sp.]